VDHRSEAHHWDHRYGFYSIIKTEIIHTPKDDVLLESKVNKHVLEPIATRTQRVRDFLSFIKPQICADVVPITDVYGPTAVDPDIQALVVSRETKGGADASMSSGFPPLSRLHEILPVAKLRASKDLPPLNTFLIDVISSVSVSLDHEDLDWLKKHKISSTAIRQWIVDKEKATEEELQNNST
jgi:phosphopantetheine adenylyltransferase